VDISDCNSLRSWDTTLVPLEEIESGPADADCPPACEEEPASAISAKFIPFDMGEDVSPATAPVLDVPDAAVVPDSPNRELNPPVWPGCEAGAD
jgi:hypothetical protein